MKNLTISSTVSNDTYSDTPAITSAVFPTQVPEFPANGIATENCNESDLHMDVADCIGREDEEQEVQLEGKRIVDINFFFQALKYASNPDNHDPGMGCTFQNLVIFDETRNGLSSRIKMKCTMCNYRFNIDTNCDHISVNQKAVLGIMSIGLGFRSLEQFLGTLDIPYVSHTTYDRHHDVVCNKLEEFAKESMRDAMENEKELAIASGDVIDGIPYITVKCDGFWAKRSYRKNYNSLSGGAAIIGSRTNKVISLGVRNKFCIICKRAESLEVDPREHRCFKNWTASSAGMESDIISEAFENSMQFGVIFKDMVADGDSSCYKKILDIDPYKDYGVTVAKIECRNHLLRNYINKLDDLTKQTDAGPLGLRKAIKNNLLRFRAAVTKSIQHRLQEDVPLHDKISNLRSDILNSPSHIFGEHKSCSKIAYFCKEKEVAGNTVIHDMRLTPLYDKMMTPVRYLANHAKSLIHNVDTNSVEQFNSIVCKHIGGKRINFCTRRSFEGRCYASVLSWNLKDAGKISSMITGRSSTILSNITLKYKNTNKCLKKKKIKGDLKRNKYY